MPTLLRRTLLASGLALCAWAVNAATYPDRPITLVIPYPPGGTTDAVARPLSVQLGKRLGVPVVLDYKSGAGGTIGPQHVARAKPDGYTLVMVLTAHAISTSVYKSLPYDYARDFTPVSMVSRIPLVLFTHSKLAPRTVPELIDYARKHPGQVSFGSSGSGNIGHLTGELFASTAGISMLHVPYKGGGPALTAAMGGEISMVFGGLDALGMARSGRLHAMAITTAERSASLPDMPTVAETLKGFEVYSWYGVMAPANTPAEVVRKLNAEITGIIQSAEFKKMVEPLGFIPTSSTPAEFGAYFQSESQRWADVVRKANVKLD